MSLSYYRHPERFLGLDDQLSDRDSSAVWVLPLPMETTTPYIGGSRFGPSSIIEASNRLERYDLELKTDGVSAYGIHTLPTFHPDLTGPAVAVESIREAVQELDIYERLFVTIGGEHTITPAILSVLAERHSDLVVVQIDARPDLRDTYDGTPWSHACAMRRALEYAPIYSFGIRSMSEEEFTFAQKSDRVKLWTADAVLGKGYLNALHEAISGKSVYLTMDVNGLDPSVIFTTGIGEPGGLDWYTCLELIRTVATEGNVIAFDCVGFSPIPGTQASAYTAAKLIYKTMNYIMRSRGKFPR